MRQIRQKRHKYRRYPLDVFEAALNNKGWTISIIKISETHYNIDANRGFGETVKISNISNVDSAIKDIWEIISDRFGEIVLQKPKKPASLSKRAIKDTLIRTTLCQYCSCKLTYENFSWDHVEPKSKGGSNDKKNLVPCCKTCNVQKGDLPVEEFLRRKLRGIKVNIQ